MMDLLERLQDTWLSQTISQSTWGYPIIGAIHVLAIALFGGAVILTNVDDVRWLKSVGLTVVIATGALLFISAPVRYYDSTFFRINGATCPDSCELYSAVQAAQCVASGHCAGLVGGGDLRRPWNCVSIAELRITLREPVPCSNRPSL